MTRSILSSDNQYVKLASSLKQKKCREETGLFVVEGVRFVREALNSSWQLEFVMLSDEEALDPRIRVLMDDLDGRGCPVMTVSSALFQKLSDTQAPQGILAVVHQKNEILTKASIESKSNVWVVLDALQDPGNVGTIIRTADASGAAGVILSEGCADLYSGKTTRATMGSLFHIPVIKASIQECLSFCRENGLLLYVTGAEAATCYSEAKLTQPCAIVFGNEGAGAGEAFGSQAAQTIKIPLCGQAESLNVASAAAVILFEAARQRGFSLSL